MSAPNLLTVRKLVAGYGQVVALDGVSIDVPEGSIVAVLGANGAGKSTLLRVLNGLLTPQGGEIVYAGEVLWSAERRKLPAPHALVARGIAHVPEGAQVFPRLTIVENLEAGAYARRAASGEGLAEQVGRILQYLPALQDKRSLLAGALSGGEQQMLALGRALMSGPRLLLLDEPSMGLAPRLVTQVFDLVARIRGELGCSVLLVEQNASAALRIADRGYVLEPPGRVVLEGPSQTLAADAAVRRSYLGY